MISESSSSSNLKLPSLGSVYVSPSIITDASGKRGIEPVGRVTSVLLVVAGSVAWVGNVPSVSGAVGKGPGRVTEGSG